MPATLSVPLAARDLQPRAIFNLNTNSGIALTIVFTVCFIGPVIMLVGLGTQRLLLRLERENEQLCHNLHQWKIHSLLGMYKDTACERCTAYRIRNIEMFPDNDDAETDQESIGLPVIIEQPEPAHVR